MQPTAVFVAAAALASAATALILTDRAPVEHAHALALAPLAVADLPPTITPPSAPRPSDATVQGIGIEGRWLVEVREADGTLVEQRAFNNAYVDEDNFLARHFTRQMTVGSPFVMIGGDAGEQHICNSGTTPTSCAIVPPEADYFSPDFNNLVVATHPWYVRLEGHVIAMRDGAVGNVQTGVLACPPAVAPSDCVGAESLHFFLTLHDLDPPIAVAKDQQVVAQVELHFGPAN